MIYFLPSLQNPIFAMAVAPMSSLRMAGQGAFGLEGIAAALETRANGKQKNKKPAKAGLMSETWCPGEDSNLHSVATART
jgi:hypothetical protein